MNQNKSNFYKMIEPTDEMNQCDLLDLIKSLQDEQVDDTLQFLGLKKESYERSNRDTSQ